MNQNAKKWLVSAWQQASEKSCIREWMNLQCHLMVLQCCTASLKESTEYSVLSCLAGERGRMCVELQP